MSSKGLLQIIQPLLLRLQHVVSVIHVVVPLLRSRHHHSYSSSARLCFGDECVQDFPDDIHSLREWLDIRVAEIAGAEIAAKRDDEIEPAAPCTGQSRVEVIGEIGQVDGGGMTHRAVEAPVDL